MQTFFLAQAVLEHSQLSSLATVFTDARYEIDALVDQITLPEIFIGLGVIVLILIAWRK
jgi:hypothetical protein